jgi:hypothetical protein
MNTIQAIRRMPIWLSFAAALFCNHAAFAYEADTASRAAAERMLEIAGGRANWRGVHGIRILSINYFAQVDLPAWFEFEIDFRTPYVRTRIANEQMNRLRVYDGDRGWSLKEENGARQLNPFDADRVAQERILWEGAFSRALFRIASEDPTLRVKLTGADRLEISDVGGGLVTWYKLGNNGFPARFGIGDSSEAEGTRLEKTFRFGPYLLPAVGVATDGGRFETIFARVLTSPVPHRSEVPSSLDGVSWSLK